MGTLRSSRDLRSGFALIITIQLLGAFAMTCADNQAIDSRADVVIDIQSVPAECVRTAKDGDYVSIHYEGTHAHDASARWGASHPEDPFEFKLGAGNIIKGLELGVSGACVGEHRRIVIPSSLVHGEDGAGPIQGGKAVVVQLQVTHILDEPRPRTPVSNDPQVDGADDPCITHQCDDPNAQCTASRPLGSKDWTIDCSECKEDYVRLANDTCVAESVLESERRLKRRRLDADWRGKAVGPVKNQGQCNAGWAFAAVAAVEGHAATVGGGLRNLSEQQLVDCLRNTTPNGCQGGYPYLALQWVARNGLVSQSEYPYRGLQGTCQKPSGSYKTRGISHISQSVSSLQNAVAKQPVAVGVDASNWALYKSGVFSNCGTGINHFVTLVGFNRNGWIVKNSWGSWWGEQGYIRLAPGNTCGILGLAVMPI